MADIHEWRHKIQSRPKTPAVSRPAAQSTINLLAPTPPTSTIRRSSKRGFTKVLSLSSTASSSSSRADNDPFSYDAWSKMQSPKPQKPDVEHACQSTMTTLLSNPTQSLPASYNSLVMRIVESHTKLRLENKRLLNDLNDCEIDKRKLTNKLRFDATEWARKEFAFEDEIQRLRSVSNGKSEDSFRALSEPEPAVENPFSSGRQTVYEFINDSGRAVTSFKDSTQATKKVPRSPLRSRLPRSPSPQSLPTPNHAHRKSHDSFSTAPESESLSTNGADDVGSDIASLQRLLCGMAQRNGLTAEEALARLSMLFLGQNVETSSTIVSTNPESTAAPFTYDKAVPGVRKQPPHLQTSRAQVRNDGRTFSFRPRDESSFQTRDLLTATFLGAMEQTPESTEAAAFKGQPLGVRTPSASVSAAKKAIDIHQENTSPQLSPSKIAHKACNTSKSRIPSPAVSQVPAAGRRGRETSSSVATTVRRSAALDQNSSSYGSSRALSSCNSDSQNSSHES